MTIDEAIKVLRTESVEIDGNAVSVCRFWEALDMAVKALDAVPVVRCRECELRRKSKQFPNNHYCLKSGLVVYPDDFCSYGERKEGAD